MKPWWVRMQPTERDSDLRWLIIIIAGLLALWGAFALAYLLTVPR